MNLKGGLLKRSTKSINFKLTKEKDLNKIINVKGRIITDITEI